MWKKIIDNDGNECWADFEVSWMIDILMNIESCFINKIDHGATTFLILLISNDFQRFLKYF